MISVAENVAKAFIIDFQFTQKPFISSLSNLEEDCLWCFDGSVHNSVHCKNVNKKNGGSHFKAVVKTNCL